MSPFWIWFSGFASAHLFWLVVILLFIAWDGRGKLGALRPRRPFGP